MIKVLEEKKEERGNPLLCHQKMRQIKAVGHSLELIATRLINTAQYQPLKVLSLLMGLLAHLKEAGGDVCPSVR